MIKKFGRLLAGVICLTAVLSGCQGDGGGGNNSNIKIFFSVLESEDYYLNWVETAQAKAREEGVQLDVEYAENSIERQDEHIKKAVAEDYDVIICSLVSADTAGSLEDAAGKTPIVFVNSAPAEEFLITDKDVAVTSLESMAGQFQVEYALSKLADKDELNVAILKGPKGRSSTNGRTKGVKQALAESGKKIHYVFEDNADYNPDKAKEIYGVFLKTGIPVDCIFCNNDNMALGAIAASEEAHVDLGSTMIFGIDASVDGCRAILDGNMDFSVFQDSKGQAETSIIAAIRLAKGESVQGLEGASEDGRYIWVPYGRVDSSNAAEYSK